MSATPTTVVASRCAPTLRGPSPAAATLDTHHRVGICALTSTNATPTMAGAARYAATQLAPSLVPVEMAIQPVAEVV